jgi:hypothetical protein
MGRAIVGAVAVVLVVLIIAIVVVYFRRRQAKDEALRHGWATKGDMNAAQEKKLKDLLGEAENIFATMMHPSAVLGDDVTLLSDKHRRAVERWLKSRLEGQK